MKQKILAVEDEQDLLFLVTKKLTDEGFEVIGAQTGGEALELVKKEKPDLILLDIMLPDIDGITVLTELSKDEKTNKIPVIVLSNLGDQASHEQVEAVGKYDYLVKAKTELNDIVKKVKSKLK